MPRIKTQVVEFDPQRVKPLAGQPRKRFKGIKELAASIAEVGQKVPGIVTLIDGEAYDAQLVDGERRLRACKIACEPFRAEVRDPADAEQIFIDSFAANFGKQDHDCIEVAEGLDRMKAAGKTIDQLARIAGKSICWVSQHLSLLKLHPQVQRMLVTEGDDEDQQPQLAYSMALMLAGLPEADQLKLARKVGGMSMTAARRLIVRESDFQSSRGRPRLKSIDAIESMCEDFVNRTGIYMDMPGADFNALVDKADNSTKRQIMKSLRETSENVLALADAIGARLPKIGAKTSAA